jgi:large conductance mechanosensitive channel
MIKQATSFLHEFKAFISRGNVIDMAVGIIIGAAFTAIVTSLVQDVIMPPLGVVLGGMDFSDFFVSLNGVQYETLKAAQDAGAPILAYGAFINAVMKFTIVSLVIFMLIRQINKLKKQSEETPVVLTRTEILLEEIRDLMKSK